MNNHELRERLESAIEDIEQVDNRLCSDCSLLWLGEAVKELRSILADMPTPADEGDILTAAYMSGRHDGKRESETPPTLDELRESGEWFLVLKYGHASPTVVCFDRPEHDYLYVHAGTDGTYKLRPGDRFKRICDTAWTEVGE